MSVRITDKNGDPPGGGKIWENQFFSRKMDLHGPENTQIHESTCQGPRGACQNFFSFTNFVTGVTFPKVTLRLPKKVLNQKIWISLAPISYLSGPVFHISLPHHCCPAQHCQAIHGVYWGKKNVILIKIRSYLLYFCPYSVEALSALTLDYNLGVNFVWPGDMIERGVGFFLILRKN